MSYIGANFNVVPSNYNESGKQKHIPATDKTADYVLTNSDAGTALFFNSATLVTATLPLISAAGDRVFILKNIGAGNLNIVTSGANTFSDSSTTITLTQYQSIVLIPDVVWRNISARPGSGLAITATGLFSTTVHNIQKRQTVISGPKDTAGLPSFLLGNSSALSTAVQNLSNTTPLVYTTGAGHDFNGEVNNIAKITANTITWSSLVAGQVNYLYGSAAANTYSKNYITPQYSWTGTPNFYPVSLLHFESNLTDVYGGAWSASNFSYTTGKFSNGISLTASTGYVQCLNATNLNLLANWTVEGWFKQGTIGAIRHLFSIGGTSSITSADLYYSATNILTLSLSSNGTSSDIASSVTSGAALTDTASFHHFALVFDGSSYKSYIDGVLFHNVTSSTKVVASTLVNIGSGIALTQGFGAVFDEFRISATARYTAGFTPAVAAFTADEVWDVFDIQANIMVNYPSATTVDRVYFGEAVANATAITSTVAYAYKGYYKIPDTVIDIANRVTFTHNIGTTEVLKDFKIKNVIAQAAYTPGMITSYTSVPTSGVGEITEHSTIESRNTISTTPGNVSIACLDRTAGSRSDLVAINWFYTGSVQRGF